jgi:hypothetical protein
MPGAGRASAPIDGAAAAARDPDSEKSDDLIETSSIEPLERRYLLLWVVRQRKELLGTRPSRTEMKSCSHDFPPSQTATGVTCVPKGIDVGQRPIPRNRGRKAA